MRQEPLLLWLALLLAGCGGGGGSSAPAAQAPQRTDLLYGYYGDPCGIGDAAPHVNLIWVFGWCGDPVTILIAAKNAGVAKAVVGVNGRTGTPDSLRWYFQQLRAAGVLSMVVAVYPQDEPDVAGMTSSEVVLMVALMRLVMAEFPELADAKVAAIYGARNRNGAEAFDWLGADNYGRGAFIPIASGPNQRLILVPGGADPWREDPQSFLEAANRTPRVIAIIPFLWRNPGNAGFGLGIADNGMLRVYCQAGAQATGKSADCARL